MMNITRRQVLAASAATAATAVLAGCGSSDDSASDGSTTYSIGSIQYVQHDALDKCYQGFVDVLDESGISYTIDEQNGNNEQSTCQTAATQFVGNSVDLIYAIATPAAQACLAATTEIPIVGCAITDYASSGLVASNEAPGGNVTGASDLNPIAEQVAMLQTVCPDAQTVGLLFCSAEANSEFQIELAEAELDSVGLSHDRYTVSGSNDIQSVVEAMAGKVDVVYVPTDNVIAAGMAQVAQICTDAGVPIICAEEGEVEAGGLCTLSIDYYELGRMSGQMALEILTEGTNPGDMPIQYEDASTLEVITNEETATALGIDLSVLDA